MLVILAEKESMAAKMAAALECVRLPDGTVYQFKDVDKHIDTIKKSMRKMTHFTVTCNGKQIYITWAQGHLCGLKQAVDYDETYRLWSKLPVPFVPKQFELKIDKGKEYRISVIKKLFEQATTIINATDPDREGDVIFGYIYEMCGCKTPYQRAWFNEVTETGIRAGLSGKSLISAAKAKPTEMAGRARSVADWLVGANLTAQMTLKHSTPGSKVTLSIGRVQTPVLQMIVEREVAIRNFKSIPFWAIEASFETAAGESFRAAFDGDRFIDKAKAVALVNSLHGYSGTVSNVTNKTYKKNPPSLYTLASLQMDANAAYSLTLTETLDCAQALYEGGYTTYARTDSAYLTDDMEQTAIDTLNALERLPEYNGMLAGKPRAFTVKKDVFNGKKVKGHHAIIPTTSVPTSLSGNRALVYDLIVKSLIRTIYPAAEGKLAKAMIDVNGATFTANGSTVTNKGWLVVGGKTNERPMPTLTTGEKVNGEYTAREGKTKPPNAYTDGSLVSAMATAGKDLPETELRKIMSDPDSGGIGRPSTRDTIPEKLIERGYVVREGKTLRATDIAIKLMELIPCQELKSSELTARWETRFNKIADSTDSYDAFVADIIAATTKWCDDIVKQNNGRLGGTGANADSSLVCPACGNSVIKYNWGWGCTAFKSGCKFSVHAEIAKKKLTDKQVQELVENGKTNVIKGFTGSKGKFDARLIYKDEKVSFFFEPRNKTSV